MKRMLSLSLLACLFTIFAWGQTRQITGRVTSDSSQPISGVNVNLKGTNTTVATNNEGRYSINVPTTGNPVLLFSSVGYTPQSINVGSRSIVDVTLSSSSNSLSDVVVIGYQTVRRKDVLASVSSVGAKDLKDIPINSAAEALNGRLAGVTATTAEGSPDAAIRIRVRGGMSITQNNDPLYIVDGVQVENALSTISPQDIQSIDVLKDAAATAIYGARGANGVIVITTKAGRVGKTQINYNGFVGVKSLARELKVMSPYDFVIYQYERSRGSSTDSASFAKSFGTTWDTLNVYKNIPAVDWQDQAFGRTGITTTHNVTASGGNQKATFLVGYTYNNDKAIVLNSNYRRHLINAKGDYKISRNIKIGLSGRYLNQDIFGAGVSSDQGASYNRLRNAVKYRPFLSPGADLTTQDPFNDPNVGNGLVLYNPIDLANSEFRNKSTEAYNLTANGSWNIIKNLTFRSTFGYDRNHFVDRQFFDSITPNAIINGARHPIVYLDTNQRTTITNSNVLDYSVKGFKNKHDFGVLLGEETYDLHTEVYNEQWKNYALNISPEDAFKQTSTATSFTGYPRMHKTRFTQLSFFGRVSYAFKDKYLLSANGRYDGASKFAPGQQWGFFPSGSFAWRIKKESFMQDVDFINDLKLRFGYGKIGNNRIDDYLYLANFSSDGKYYYSINGQPVIAYYPSSLPNPNLQWESTVNKNYGIDVSLLRGKLDLSVDVYNNSSDQLLLNVPIASTFGYTTQLQNIGKTSNKGVEFQLNATVMRKKSFTWTANFNFSHNVNKVVALGVGQTNIQAVGYSGVSGQPTDYIVRPGDPVGSMWGWVADGFYTVNDFDYDPATRVYKPKTGVISMNPITGMTVPGYIKFKDISGPNGKPDGIVDNYDKTIIGNPNPKFTGGLNQQFTYKRWDASLFVNFVYGADVYNANKIEFTNSYSNNSNMLNVMNNRWKTIDADGNVVQGVTTVSGINYATGIAPDQLAALNANATIWQPIKGAGAFYPNSWAIEDGSFLRINNLTIGYSFPVKSLARMKMNKLRLYFTANNLAVITNYTGYDPEVSVATRAGNLPTPNLDYSAYPKSRTFIFGVNANF